MKKLTLWILVLLILVTTISCTQYPNNEKERTEYLYSGMLENGGRWFMAEMYLSLAYPLEGSYEREQTDAVYVNSVLTNSETRESYSFGTIVRIEYDGEMYLPSGMDAPIITNVYSVTLAPFPYTNGIECFAVYKSFPYYFDHEAARSLCVNLKESDEHVPAPFVFKVDSAEKLVSDYTAIRPDYITGNAVEEVSSYIGNYDDAFFEENVLVLVLFASGSGGDRYKIESISIDQSRMNVNIIQTNSGQTCDTSEWLFCISVPRKTAKSITEFDACYIN